MSDLGRILQRAIHDVEQIQQPSPPACMCCGAEIRGGYVQARGDRYCRACADSAEVMAAMLVLYRKDEIEESKT